MTSRSLCPTWGLKEVSIRWDKTKVASDDAVPYKRVIFYKLSIHVIAGRNSGAINPEKDYGSLSSTA
jgi:hypothetical protein